MNTISGTNFFTKTKTLISAAFVLSLLLFCFCFQGGQGRFETPGLYISLYNSRQLKDVLEQRLRKRDSAGVFGKTLREICIYIKEKGIVVNRSGLAKNEIDAIIYDGWGKEFEISWRESNVVEIFSRSDPSNEVAVVATIGKYGWYLPND